MIEKIPELDSKMQGDCLMADLESWFRQGSASTDFLGPDAELPDLWFGVLMIAAVAISSSLDRQEFQKCGATAVRTDVLLGAIVGVTEA